MPYLSFPSPLGDLTLFEENETLIALEFGWAPEGEATPLLEEGRRQIDAYFEARLKHFDLPLAPRGSPFQKSVWTALSAIPYGTTCTYGALALRLDTGPRAIGGACGHNPLPIVIPCHRVLAAAGVPGGYSGAGGLETKRTLLAIEQRTLA